MLRIYFSPRYQHPEQISNIDYAGRYIILVNNGDVNEALLLHQRQNIPQGSRWLTVCDIPYHHISSHCRGGAFAVAPEIANDIRFRDDTCHRSIGLTDDDKANMLTRKHARNFHERRIHADHRQSRLCLSFDATDKYAEHFCYTRFDQL